MVSNSGVHNQRTQGPCQCGSSPSRRYLAQSCAFVIGEGLPGRLDADQFDAEKYPSPRMSPAMGGSYSFSRWPAAREFRLT